MDYTVKDIVQNIAQGDNITARDAFDSILADKVISTIQAKREQMSAKFFGNAQQVDATDDASVDSEEQSVEDETTQEEQ